MHHFVSALATGSVVLLGVFSTMLVPALGGEADVIKDAIEELGEIALWRIAIKPGKPFVFGHACSTPFIGLPGNPASAFVTLAILARPFISALQGRSDGELRSLPVFADFSLAQPASRTEVVRVHLTMKDEALVALEPYITGCHTEQLGQREDCNKQINISQPIRAD